jgi:hypothetical protein
MRPSPMYVKTSRRPFLLYGDVNEVFQPIPQLNYITEGDKNKQGSISAGLFNLVGPDGQIVELVHKEFIRIQQITYALNFYSGYPRRHYRCEWRWYKRNN